MLSAPATPALPQAHDYLFRMLRKLEVHHVFGVLSTRKIPLLSGTYYPENDITYIEYPHGNSAIGAAIGAVHMTGRPGVVVMPVTSEVTRGFSNLLNTVRSRVPLLILCCPLPEQAVPEWLPAASLPGPARHCPRQAYEVHTAEELPVVLQQALREVLAPLAGPVFVTLPWALTRACHAE